MSCLKTRCFPCQFQSRWFCAVLRACLGSPTDASRNRGGSSPPAPRGVLSRRAIRCSGVYAEGTRAEREVSSQDSLPRGAGMTFYRACGAPTAIWTCRLQAVLPRSPHWCTTRRHFARLHAASDPRSSCRYSRGCR